MTATNNRLAQLLHMHISGGRIAGAATQRKGCDEDLEDQYTQLVSAAQIE